MTSFFTRLAHRLFFKKPDEPEPQPPSSLDAFFALPISDIMIPRSDIVAVDIHTPLNELMTLFLKTNFQVLPVYRETLDHITGTISVRCLLSLLGTENEDRWNRHLSMASFVPTSVTIKEAFQRMSKCHKDALLFIVDEHGGVEGMLTKNHILNALSAHCFDDEEEDEAIADAPFPLISGRMDIDTFAEEFETDTLFSEDDENKVNTIGGWLCSFLGRVPTKGEVISHPSGFVFEITKADPRKIHEITVLKRPAKDAE